MAVRYCAHIATTEGAEWPETSLIGATGTVVAAGTSNPLTISEDEQGNRPIPGAQLTITAQCMVPGFWCQDDAAEAEWVSGNYRVPLDSLTGVRAFAESAAQRADEAAQQAAANVADTARVVAEETAASLSGTFETLAGAARKYETPGGAQAKADAAEAAAKEYAGTLAYGTNLEATDAATATWVRDPASATGAALAGAYATRGDATIHAVTKPTMARAARATPVSTPTYDGTGIAVHPSVYFNPEGWAGYRYWMAMTPYANSDNQIENPSILCSNDGDTWHVPAGLTNPIAPAPTNGCNSDAFLTVDRSGTMYCFWREYIYDTAERHVFRTSRDGVTWTPKQTAREDSTTMRRIMSPSYLQTADGWVMYGVDILNRRAVVRATATDVTGPWTDPEDCLITGSTAKVWHIDVHPVGGEWHMLAHTNTSDGAGGDLHAAVSQDGLAFELGEPFVARGQAGVDWDAAYYKSCFVPAVHNGLHGWDAWLGGSRFTGPAPIIGRTFVAFTDLPAGLSDTLATMRDDIERLKAKAGEPSIYLVLDSFNRPDQAGLGATETGQTWEASAGTFNIAGNQATVPASTNTRAFVDTGAADHHVTAQLPAGAGAGMQHWILARGQDGANYYRYGVGNDGLCVLQKVVGGAAQNVVVLDGVTVAAGDVLGLKAQGTTLTLYRNGTALRTVTDTALTTGTRVGLQASNAGAAFDDFEVTAT